MRRRHRRLARTGGLFLALLAVLGCGDGHDYVPAYDIEFFATGSGRLGALQLEVEHLGDSGEFIGRRDSVDCISLVDALFAANYQGERLLKIGLIRLEGVRIPSAIVRCGFRTRENLTPASFSVVVTDASDTASTPVDPPPGVVVSAIRPR